MKALRAIQGKATGCFDLGNSLLHGSWRQETYQEVVMWTRTQRQTFLAVFSFVIFVLLPTAHPLHAQYVTTTVGAGTSQWAFAVNPATNRIYVSNYGLSLIHI